LLLFYFKTIFLKFSCHIWFTKQKIILQNYNVVQNLTTINSCILSWNRNIYDDKCLYESERHLLNWNYKKIGLTVINDVFIPKNVKYLSDSEIFKKIKLKLNSSIS